MKSNGCYYSYWHLERRSEQHYKLHFLYSGHSKASLRRRSWQRLLEVYNPYGRMDGMPGSHPAGTDKGIRVGTDGAEDEVEEDGSVVYVRY